MVKLEGNSGGVVYVDPAKVTCIAEGSYGDQTVVHVPGSFSTVKGTPDEVHAKLFLSSPSDVRRWRIPEGSNFYDVRAVLEYVARHEEFAEDMVRLARKALGREGT